MHTLVITNWQICKNERKNNISLWLGRRTRCFHPIITDAKRLTIVTAQKVLASFPTLSSMSLAQETQKPGSERPLFV